MSYSRYNDQKLLAFLKQNRREAYNEIYNRYWKKMLQVCWNHSRNDYIAQDMVQETFIDLWERYHDYQIENLPAFLATAIKYKIFRYYRTEHRRLELAQENYRFEEISFDDEKLEPGISENQTEEMKANRLQLVYRTLIHETYKQNQRNWLMILRILSVLPRIDSLEDMKQVFYEILYKDPDNGIKSSKPVICKCISCIRE